MVFEDRLQNYRKTSFICAFYMKPDITFENVPRLTTPFFTIYRQQMNQICCRFRGIDLLTTESQQFCRKVNLIKKTFNPLYDLNICSKWREGKTKRLFQVKVKNSLDSKNNHMIDYIHKMPKNIIKIFYVFHFFFHSFYL